MAKNAQCGFYKVKAFAGNPKTTAIVSDSPTNMATNDAEFDCFYDNLRKAIDETPPHRFLTVLRDINAKISSAHVKYANNIKLSVIDKY